jgi:hypothetical protein
MRTIRNPVDQLGGDATTGPTKAQLESSLALLRKLVSDMGDEIQIATNRSSRTKSESYGRVMYRN